MTFWTELFVGGVEGGEGADGGEGREGRVERLDSEEGQWCAKYGGRHSAGRDEQGERMERRRSMNACPCLAREHLPDWRAVGRKTRPGDMGLDLSAGYRIVLGSERAREGTSQLVGNNAHRRQITGNKR